MSGSGDETFLGLQKKEETMKKRTMKPRGKRIAQGGSFLAALVLAASVWMMPASVHASMATNPSTVEHAPKKLDQAELKWFYPDRGSECLAGWKQ